MILAQYDMKTSENGCDTPSAILSRQGSARYGGVSHTGPLSLRIAGRKKTYTTLEDPDLLE